MCRVILFGGAYEGRKIAEYLNRNQIDTYVCVATEYGETLIQKGSYLTIHNGRLDEQEIGNLLREKKPELVIDATHPYASEATANITQACQKEQVEYLRLLRAGKHGDPSCIYVDSAREAAAYLNQTEGNVLLTTGSKELQEFTGVADYQNRLFARVLSLPEVARQCAELGFVGMHLICMQGPFSEELNRAMLKQINASYLVTKETGRAGGFEEKVNAAKSLGVKVVVIGRPEEETGRSISQLKSLLAKKFGFPQEKRRVVLAGIGMGRKENATLEVLRACREADLLIGAERMLEAFSDGAKPTYTAYKSQEIKAYIDSHPEYENIAVLLSGDPGFYSGARKLQELLGDYQVTVLPGVSSVVYLCAKLQMPWEDVALLSLHGKQQNLIAAVAKNHKVFALTGGSQGVRDVCEKLIRYGYHQARVHVGQRLSYEDEAVVSGAPEEILKMDLEPLSAVLIENPGADSGVVTQGIPDESFLRAKVPMTKSEIRSCSLSKLALTKNSVVYDIGAGTGSVSIEMALAACDGFVYAVEKKEEACGLIKENQKKFGVDNLQVISGLAPEAIMDLPAPSHAFIGGSSGNLQEILVCLLKKNPAVRIVINAIALETIAEAATCLRSLPFTEIDITQVSIAKAKELGSYHMMMGQNPVFIFSCRGGGKQ